MGAIASSGRPDALDTFHKVMLASASIPGVFPPVYFDIEADITTLTPPFCRRNLSVTDK
jgi:predicted acylesterase/phospholipase RssA